jgi:hypothetical protein
MRPKGEHVKFVEWEIDSICDAAGGSRLARPGHPDHKNPTHSIEYAG